MKMDGVQYDVNKGGIWVRDGSHPGKVPVDAVAFQKLLTKSAPAVLVRANGSVNGIVTRYDVVRALTQSRA